jgi:hypothetical protein
VYAKERRFSFAPRYGMPVYGSFGFGKVDVGSKVFKGDIQLYAPLVVEYRLSQ